MEEESIYISNSGKKNQRTHICTVSNNNVISRIKYSIPPSYPEFLFKFYPINEYSIDALINNYLFAANPVSFNDPFDCPIQLWDEKIFRQPLLIDSFNPLFRDIWEDNPDENKEKFFSFVYGFTGIICLNNPRVKNQDLMWGYYSNQQGFTISFNSDELIKSWGLPFPIEYLDKDQLDRFFIDSMKRKELIELTPIILRWTTQKNKKWDKENEWRFLFLDCLIDTITFKPKIEERKRKYNYNAINEIILGSRFFDLQYSVNKNFKQFVYLTSEKSILQNKLLTFLSIPQKIKIRHMFMKKDELHLYPRECIIFRQDEQRFLIEYLE